MSSCQLLIGLLMGTDYVRLSPGEEERYRQETSKRLRCERLRQVRRREDEIAKELRQAHAERQRQELEALKAAELQAQLQAKRAKLAGLLEERALAEALTGAADREAAARGREAELHTARAAAEEAGRKQLEAERALEALRSSRAARLAATQPVVVRKQRLEEVRSAEQLRARRAAELGRKSLTVAEAAAKEEKLLAEEAAKYGPIRVLKTDTYGLEEYAKTYYHTVQHDQTDAQVEVEAEFERPLSPPPCPTPMQVQIAADRGKAAAKASAARKQQEAKRQEAEAAEKLKRQEEACALGVAAGKPKTGSAKWTVELLPWKMKAVSKHAMDEIKEILEDSRAVTPPGLRWSESKLQTPQRPKRPAGRVLASWSLPAPAKEPPTVTEERPQWIVDEETMQAADITDVSAVDEDADDLANSFAWSKNRTPSVQEESSDVHDISSDSGLTEWRYGNPSANRRRLQELQGHMEEQAKQWNEQNGPHGMGDEGQSLNESSIDAHIVAAPWVGVTAPLEQRVPAAQAASSEAASAEIRSLPGSPVEVLEFSSSDVGNLTADLASAEQDKMEGLLHQAQALLEETAKTASNLSQSHSAAGPMPMPPADTALGRRWAADDLSARLEEICRELDDVVGIGEAESI